MPTVLRIGPYRFFFYSNENNEPAHIHVRPSDSEAKFWLDPTRLVWNKGFNEREIGQILDHLRSNLPLLLTRWTEYFGEAHDES
ncbi:MAG: DUF4160 domain-containing protein [Anaerolinea sp.]|nr:DUF4160 domain-containing protein [Anaerolinea sp.]